MHIFSFTSRQIEAFFRSVIIAITAPIALLNWVGWLVSGVWLVFLGEWSAILMGIVLGLLLPDFIIGIALLPTLLLGAVTMALLTRGHKKIGTIVSSFAVLYNIVVIILWCTYIMWFFVSNSTENSFTPALIWSYGVALTPWMSMAQKERGAGNEFSAITVFFAQISYLSSMMAILFGAKFEVVFKLFGLIMLVAVLLEILLAYQMEKKQNVEVNTYE